MATNQTMKVVSGIFSGSMERINIDTNKDVISRLKFICQVKKGEKINTKYMFVQPDGIVTRFSRTFVNIDNRINTLTFIKNTISRSFDIIQLNINSNKTSEKHLAINILKDLDKCKIGLNNLKETYVEDSMFNCEIETLIEEIDGKLNEFENYTIQISPALSSNNSQSHTQITDIEI